MCVWYRLGMGQVSKRPFPVVTLRIRTLVFAPKNKEGVVDRKYGFTDPDVNG